MRRDGELVPASWDEALELVARRFGEVRDAHGADALAGFASARCTNEENYLFQKFMRAVVGTQNVDHCARLCHASTVTGLRQSLGSGAMTNSFKDLEELDVARPAVMRETLVRLVGEGVVSHYGDGDDDIYWVDLAKHHEAAFYRNTMVHFFVARAITELAALGAAEQGAEDINSATWLRARRLKDLLRFEFFFPGTLEFAGEVASEIRLIYPEWEGESFTAGDVLQRMGSLQLILAHRVIGPILEAYRVLAEELALLGDQPADESALVERSLKVAHQRWLQKMLPTAESISRDYFRNAAKVAAKLGLFDAETEDLAQQREAFAAELRETVRQLDQLRGIAQSVGQPVLAQRATR